MIEQELRELDNWIAEQGGAIETHCKTVGWTPPFTEDPSHFAAVKREIEQRGWAWNTRFLPDDKHVYFCVNRKPTDEAIALHAKIADTEQLAGCLAFKTAVEAQV